MTNTLNLVADPPSAPPRPMWAGYGFTDGSGDIEFTFPNLITGQFPVCTIGVEADDGAVYFHKITAIGQTLSLTSVAVHVDRSTDIEVAGIGVLAAQTASVGRRVHLIATVAG